MKLSDLMYQGDVGEPSIDITNKDKRNIRVVSTAVRKKKNHSPGIPDDPPPSNVGTDDVMSSKDHVERVIQQ